MNFVNWYTILISSVLPWQTIGSSNATSDINCVRPDVRLSTEQGTSCDSYVDDEHDVTWEYLYPPGTWKQHWGDVTGVEWRLKSAVCNEHVSRVSLRDTLLWTYSKWRHSSQMKAVLPSATKAVRLWKYNVTLVPEKLIKHISLYFYGVVVTVKPCYVQQFTGEYISLRIVSPNFIALNSQ